MSKLSTLLATVFLLTYANLSLACDRPAKPELPDPATAVTPQMVKAKNDVQAFLASAEAYLKCNISTSQHNSMVDAMHEVAESFNAIVRAYKARMSG